MRVLLTRPLAESASTAAKLLAMGHTPVSAPVITIEYQDFTLPKESFDAVVVTSPHALHALDENKISRLKSLPFFVVGERAAQAVKLMGLEGEVISEPDAVHLIAAIKADTTKNHLLYLAGRHRSLDLEEAFAGDIFVVETYHASEVENLPALAVQLMLDGKIDALLHFSKRSAELFLARANACNLANALLHIKHIAISNRTAESLKGLPVVIADTPDEDGILAALAALAPHAGSK